MKSNHNSVGQNERLLNESFYCALASYSALVLPWIALPFLLGCQLEGGDLRGFLYAILAGAILWIGLLLAIIGTFLSLKQLISENLNRRRGITNLGLNLGFFLFFWLADKFDIEMDLLCHLTHM